MEVMKNAVAVFVGWLIAGGIVATVWFWERSRDE
jgi:hypothetical protein